MVGLRRSGEGEIRADPSSPALNSPTKHMEAAVGIALPFDRRAPTHTRRLLRLVATGCCSHRAASSQGRARRGSGRVCRHCCPGRTLRGPRLNAEQQQQYQAQQAEDYHLQLAPALRLCSEDSTATPPTSSTPPNPPPAKQQQQERGALDELAYHLQLHPALRLCFWVCTFLPLSYHQCF
jgi:hypothetical protein